MLTIEEVLNRKKELSTHLDSFEVEKMILADIECQYEMMIDLEKRYQ